MSRARVEAAGRSASSSAPALNLGSFRPEGRDSVHCHSEDEEIVVVLEGSGTLAPAPSPQIGAQRTVLKTRSPSAPVMSSRACRPLGIAHGIRAGKDGMTYLAYGTRKPNDICYYPRSNKIYFRGVGLIARLETSTTTTASLAISPGVAGAGEDVNRERDVLLGGELVG